MPSSDIKKILVVEDDDIVRMLMVDVLEELEFTVVEADSWDMAEHKLKHEGGIDLMVTDVGLQDAKNRDGIDLARRARELHASMPVVVASGYGNTLVLPPGVTRLDKPFSIDQLRDAISDLSKAS